MKATLRKAWCLETLLPYLISKGGWATLLDISSDLEIDCRELTNCILNSRGAVEYGHLWGEKNKIARSGNHDHYAGTEAVHMIKHTPPRRRARGRR